MKVFGIATAVAMACLLASEALGQCSHDPDEGEVRCDLVPVETCRKEGHNTTSFPTPLYPTPDLVDGRIEFSFLDLLVYLGCSQYVPVENFICSAAFPLCSPNLFRQVRPCREFCVSVRETCTQDLAEVGEVWPAALDCNNFPPYGSEICVWDGTLPCGDDTPPPPITTAPPLTTDEGPTSEPSRAVCPSELVSHPNGSGVEFGGMKDCGESCYGAYFNRDQHNFALIWITLWSLVCLLVAVVCFLTYVLNFSNVQGPESSIYYIALCYAFLALAYTISIAVGRENLFCNGDLTSGKNESALVTDGFEVPLCAVIFSVQYYFSLCSWLWWAVLATEWFLCSLKLKSISYKLKACCHVVGWGLPLVFLLTALPLKLAAGEPVLRTCWLSRGYEPWFIVCPLLVLLLYCSVVIVVTFGRIVHLYRHPKGRNVPRANGIKLHVLIRVGLYATVYLLPVGLLICCHWYQYSFREKWEEEFIECSNDDKSDCGHVGPKFGVFILQFTASMIMGVLTAFWVIANKESFSAWNRAICICRDKQSSAMPDPTLVRYTENNTPSPFVLTDSSI